MKYSKDKQPLQCIMSQSTCYKGTVEMKPVGVLWHSTGANNSTLKRYVQPDDDASNRQELLNLLGVNKYKNDWNHGYIKAGVNAWIGKLENGEVATIQTLPWNFRPWGCGSGSKGSCNSGWIQFEICEDNLKNKNYFDKVYAEGCELTAYCCQMYNINPLGFVEFGGVKVPTILCHDDAHRLGLGSNHSDVYHWFEIYGKTMDDVRKDVAKLMSIDIATSPKEEVEPQIKYDNETVIKKNDIVTIVSGATYESGKPVPSWVREKQWIVSSINSERVIIDKSVDKKYSINSPINCKYLQKVDQQKEEEGLYSVKINTKVLNCRKGPSTSYERIGTVSQDQVFTIIKEENGWGQLASNKSWICLQYTIRIEKDYWIYTVKNKNESLWKIAEKNLGNGIRYTEIKKLNGLTSDIIHIGDQLKIPNV